MPWAAVTVQFLLLGNHFGVDGCLNGLFSGYFSQDSFDLFFYVFILPGPLEVESQLFP